MSPLRVNMHEALSVAAHQSPYKQNQCLCMPQAKRTGLTMSGKNPVPHVLCNEIIQPIRKVRVKLRHKLWRQIRIS